MTTSLSNHSPSARPVDDPYEEQLRGLSYQQLADRLNWLSWYQPGIFTALMDYMEFIDTLAANTTDPTNPDPDPDDVNYGEAPAAVCARCGSDIGIFIKLGLDWRHYQEGSALGKPEIFDPGHAPALAYRLPSPPPLMG